MRALIPTLAVLAFACGDAPVDDPAADDGIPWDLEVEPIGPAAEDVEAFMATLLQQPDLVAWIDGGRARILSFELVFEAEEPDGVALPTTAFQAMVHHYDRQETVQVGGDILDTAVPLTLTTTKVELPPTVEEFGEAVNLMLAEDPAIRDAYGRGEIEFFRAMPPLVPTEDGHRILSVGVRPIDAPEPDDEIVGADLTAEAIYHYAEKAPPTARVGALVCNPAPSAWQSTTRRGTPGYVHIVLRDKRTRQPVWDLFAVRPSASSGNYGSGLELLEVEYQGKKVLAQAHVPILNVEYEGGTCGPYRDWQYEEDSFRRPVDGSGAVVGFEAAPGFWFARSSTPGLTLRETGSDQGDWNGVVGTLDQNGFILISELTAGWYRYMSEFRFFPDGTLVGAFGFDAVQNGCTCQRHNHHAYWRLDFDFGDTEYEEFRDSTGWVPITEEQSSLKDPADNTHWRAIDRATGDSWLLTPQPDEDLADAYSGPDAYFLAYDPGEVDDSGRDWRTWGTRAALADFVDGESLVGTDTVMWYSAHFLHDDTDPDQRADHTVRFRLQPESW